jgi:hypothetical protein
MIKALILIISSMMFFTLAFIYSANVVNVFNVKIMLMIFLIWSATVFTHWVSIKLTKENYYGNDKNS